MTGPLPLPTRRGFLAGLAAASVSTTALRAASPQSVATWNLVAIPTSTAIQGVNLPFFRFQSLAGGASRGALPYFEATEGELIDIIVDNQLPVAIQPAIINVQDGPRIDAGSSATFRFRMPRAGTYLLGPARPPWATGVDAPTHAPDVSGLAGTLISRPASGAQELWSDGPAFDSEYVLIYEDADERLNNSMASGSSAPLPPYEPNYFVVNGYSYPDTVGNADTYISGLVGERILIRMGNLGRMRQSIHFHGYHLEPLARDNVPETVLPHKDTFPLPAFSTLDLMLVPNQRGVFPVHPHSLTAVTANGRYPFGQLALMDIR